SSVCPNQRRLFTNPKHSRTAKRDTRARAFQVAIARIRPRTKAKVLWRLLGFGLLLHANRTGAAVITAKTGAVSDVARAVAAAVAGDTVAIPAGIYSWSSQLT